MNVLRRLLAVALSVGLAACAIRPGARTLSAPGWEGCTVADLGGTIRELRCDDVNLRVMRAQTLGDETGVAAVARGLAKQDGAPETMRAAERDVPARVGDGWIVAAPRPEVIAYCRERHARLPGCRAAITTIARDGLPAGVAFPGPRLVLLGRTLAVPPGCELAGAERIACETTGTALDWREQTWTGSADAALDAGSQLLHASFSHVKEDRVPCVLVGRAGRGARYEIRTEVGLTRALACVVVHDGVVSMAQCLGAIPPAAPYPVPCGQVLQDP